MLAAMHFRRQEESSHPSMASSVYESINRTRCIRTSVNYNILLVYRNQPKRYRTAIDYRLVIYESLCMVRAPASQPHIYLDPPFGFSGSAPEQHGAS